MAFYSILEYTATGITSLYTTPPYLEEAHLTVTKDGVGQVLGTDYTLSGTALTFSVTPTIGSAIRIARRSNPAGRLVDYTSGSGFSEKTLDLDSLQAFYLAQEGFDAQLEGSYPLASGEQNALNIDSLQDDLLDAQNSILGLGTGITPAQEAVLEHIRYDEPTQKLIADRAIETTLNSLYLGQQHKMSSGSENIFFTNLSSDINFFPMWGGLKDQSITVNQGASGFIPPSGRIYSDMFSLPLGGSPDPLTSTGYSGDNYFGINITGLGITTVAAEQVDPDVRLEYRITINGRQVYMQPLPRNAPRSSAGETIYPNDVIEWYFDHPVDVRAGTTLYAEIVKVRIADDVELGVFQVRQGDTVDPNTGLLRYQATVHNRLFEDKDLELISPYLKYQAMDFGLDSTGATILLRDLSLGSDTLLVPHAVNTLQAVANGTNIQIKIKDGQKVIVESLPVSGVSINGSLVNSVLNQAVLQLNDIFTNSVGFTSVDTYVNGFDLTGNDLTLTLSDGTSYTTDVTSLGVDENNFVASGTLSGSNLILTMDDATTVTVDASGLAVDANDVVESGTLNGTDLELTLSNASVITIDVSSLAVDTTLYVESGVLSGTDLILTMSDASTVTIDATGLAVDEDTTVTGGVVNGTDIELSLSDSSTITIDATSLGGSTGSSNEVVSGAVVGTDLILTMSDATQITIDASNMVNGSSSLATNDNWNISYGTNANTAVGVSTVDSSVWGQMPFYFGRALTRGSEFRFNMTTSQQMRLGIWDGAEAATPYNSGGALATNFSTCFSFLNGGSRWVVGTNTVLMTGTQYVIANNAPMGIRFGTDGHLTLVDYSSGTEVFVAKTQAPLGVTEFNLQMGSWANATFPNGILSNSDYVWEIVHDLDNSENGVLDGVETHTVLKSAISFSAGEKLMFNLDKLGAGETFGTDYTSAATGVANAEDYLVGSFKYQTNESIIGDVSWSHNTSSSNYFAAGGGTIPSWRVGGANNRQGLFSLRYLLDNSLELWSETENELVATSLVDADGSPIHFFMGVNGNTNYTDLPNISKQTIGQGTQPDVNFVPTVADQTITVTEGDTLNFQIITSDNIVNQFAESDAPSWMSLNQTSGVLSGTAPAFVGTSADTIVVNCKAGNAIGGTVNFTVTVTVAQIASSYTNSNSLSLNGTSSYLQGNPINMNALERATNGDGSAWTIGMWVKPSSTTATQTLLVYGAGNDYAGGAITLKQINATSLVLNYGTVYNSIILVAGGALTPNTWQHIMVTFDGGTTGSSSGALSSYYSRFSLAVDGVVLSPIGANANYGYTGAISGANPSDNIYRIGRASNVHNNYADAIINQVAIWNTDESANLATIYNSGATQDLSLLASAPAHYYEMETSVTTITDITGSADLVGNNFSSSDLVTDTP